MKIGKIAVSDLSFSADRPYDYRIPEELADTAVPGVRVLVPFGRGNHPREGILLSLAETTDRQELKSISSVLDPAPVLDARQLSLVLWMRERFFCTVYSAVHTMLPAGMWFNDQGLRRTGDKTAKLAVLAVDGEEALTAAAERRRRAPMQAAALELLASLGAASLQDLRAVTGATAPSIQALARDGLVTIELVEVFRRPVYRADGPRPEPVRLNAAQARARDALCGMLETGSPQGALLYGVTGSGKTQVYIQVIQKALSMGKQAIMLVPEISLTPQLMGQFLSEFGDRVAILHSSLSQGERLDEWKRIRSGQADVVVGTRSAVFAPTANTGVIILDEEQEHTYKSENAPRYHARDVAKYRCAHENALLILGSATPSVETMFAARSGRLRLLELPERYNRQELPQVIMADRKSDLKSGLGGSIGAVLRRELADNLAAGEQTILFINRRGTAGLVLCGECGQALECPHCSVSLTYHAYERRLICHYCGFSRPLPELCPDCGGKLKQTGAGTQRVEAEVQELFPGTQVLRMDTDTVSPARSHERILEEFRQKNIPVLVGTQMVAKGLNFPNVTLVGVISADQSLYSGSLRAHERTFSLITQVVGRSGRGLKPGRAVIQTFTPEQEILRLAAAQDYPAFYAREIALREITKSPPFTELIAISVTGEQESQVVTGCAKIRNSLAHYLADTDCDVLGPAPETVVRVNNRYRYRVILRGKADRRVRETVAHVLREFASDNENRKLTVSADLDPAD